jgi:hypothetical protein
METKKRQRRYITLPQSEIELARIMKDAAGVASVQALVSTGVINPYMSMRECYRTYGAGMVNGWLRQGLIHKIKDGDDNTKVRISRVEIEAAARTSNRAEWQINRFKTGQFHEDELQPIDETGL